jgi:hypothetical protein
MKIKRMGCGVNLWNIKNIFCDNNMLIIKTILASNQLLGQVLEQPKKS